MSGFQVFSFFCVNDRIYLLNHQKHFEKFLCYFGAAKVGKNWIFDFASRKPKIKIQIPWIDSNTSLNSYTYAHFLSDLYKCWATHLSYSANFSNFFDNTPNCEIFWRPGSSSKDPKLWFCYFYGMKVKKSKILSHLPRVWDITKNIWNDRSFDISQFSVASFV